jgi:hypothetical protein
MGASWLEVDKLIREVELLSEFPHSEALPQVTRARDMVAETAMVVSLAALSEEPQAEKEAQDLMARARVAVMEARVAIQRATDAVAACRAGRGRAEKLVAEARALRARDRSGPTLRAGRATPVTMALALRQPEPFSAS